MLKKLKKFWTDVVVKDYLTLSIFATICGLIIFLIAIVANDYAFGFLVAGMEFGASACMLVLHYDETKSNPTPSEEVSGDD